MGNPHPHSTNAELDTRSLTIMVDTSKKRSFLNVPVPTPKTSRSTQEYRSTASILRARQQAIVDLVLIHGHDMVLSALNSVIDTQKDVTITALECKLRSSARMVFPDQRDSDHAYAIPASACEPKKPDHTEKVFLVQPNSDDSMPSMSSMSSGIPPTISVQVADSAK